MRPLPQLLADRRTSERALNKRTSPEFEALPTGLFPEMEVLTGEPVEERESLVIEFYAEYQPVTPTQRSFVDSLADSEWQLRRYRKVEAQLYDIECGKAFANGGGGNACEAYAASIDVFARLHRHIEACQRAIVRAVGELERLGCTHHPVEPRPRPKVLSYEELLAVQPPLPPPEPDLPPRLPEPPPPVRLTTPDLPLDYPTRPKRSKLASLEPKPRIYPDSRKAPKPSRSASPAKADPPAPDPPYPAPRIFLL
jgi:hypothetical protein